MGLGRQLRSAFTPEALSTFDHTMDEVCTELLADGLLSLANRDADQTRTRVARKLITFASSGWSAVQIKQLLLRTLRNEHSAARPKTVRLGRCGGEPARRPAAVRGAYQKALEVQALR
jgi:hypothetical protein